MTSSFNIHNSSLPQEWLEADGFGGFAWSVGEALRLDQVVLAEREEARTSVRFTAPKTETFRIPIPALRKKIGAHSRPRATRHARLSLFEFQIHYFNHEPNR